MAGVQHQPGPRQSNSHIMALLSLKVLLLAFFILLNALATFEDERSTAVLDSVREAFRGVVPAQESYTVEAAAVGILEGPEDVVEALGRLFDDSLPITQQTNSANSRILQVDLLVEDFFSSSGNQVAGEGLDTLRAIAAVLTDQRFADADYRLDLLYGLQGSRSGLEGQALPLRRAGALVRALERENIPSERLSAGLMPSYSGQLRLLFAFSAPQNDDGEAATEVNP